ncbi:MAG TPA: TetR/AcrR family transcriptional regulator [Desulfobacteraceae bacterium]|nr:TetR/AcrR family transcriptional regulator [Desulfobacteraceae bacterium]
MAKQSKRSEITGAALELIVEHGFHGASMAMIADRAGVGAGTIYRYFDNKDVLITELYRELEEKVVQVLMKEYPAEKSFRERFQHIGERLLHHFINNPSEFRYLEQFHNSPYGVAVRRDKFMGKWNHGDLVRIFFQDGMARGVIKDLPLAVHFALAFGPLVGVARDHILGFISLDDSLRARIVEACWQAIREPSPGFAPPNAS